jgi:glycosyltransferase involved in cell wall biosynthesis
LLSHYVCGEATRSPGGTDAATSAPKPSVAFIAHEVGTSGGMERVSEQLVRRLLDAGHQVTVIARRCELPAHQRMTFVRVPTPARPASIAYPMFFVVGSLLALRRRESVLHVTGAIVANHADVCTVHYCHRAAVRQLEGSRASRPGTLYRINAWLGGVMARVGELWCYRPGRTGLLCAVSSGVADELEAGFPAMIGKVRTVRNGVDEGVFRPDPAARATVRSELGLDPSTRLALFVGGDWGRKGLAYAIDALAQAPDWHLVVAGAGDPGPHEHRAHHSGTESRLHFVGPERRMARLYAAADAFVLPTAYETFSLSTFEAAASGVPLLVTPVNGVRDMLEHGCNGWFISRDANEIAIRLNQLSAEPELAQSISAMARAAIRPYSWHAMAQSYRSVYAEVGQPCGAPVTAD